MSKLLGHASLSTTTRYLNIQRRGLHLAMETLEESQRAAAEEKRKKAEEQERKNTEPVAQALHTEEREPQASVQEKDSVSLPPSPWPRSGYCVVRKRGFEPPLPCGNKALRTVPLSHTAP